MKIRTILALSLAAFAALSLAGCNFNLNYLVPNARLADVETVLKDYSGLSGYTITYADDATGAYRVVVGKAVLPAPSEVKHESRIIERQYAVLVIQMSQQGKDVFINAQSTGQVDASNQYRGFIDFLKGKGYTVQEIR